MGELTYNKEKAAAAASLLLNKVSAAAIAARLKDKPLPSGFVLELTEQSIVDDHRINQYLAAQKEEKHEPKFTGLYDSLEDTTRAKNPLLGELYAEIQEREGLDTLIALQVKSHSKSTATAADGTTEKREVITLGQASTDGIVPTLQSKIDTSKIDNEKIKNLINSTKDEDTKFLEDYTTSATYDALYTIATQNDGSTVLDLSEVIKTSKESDDKNRSQKLTTLSRVFRCKLDATEDFIDQEIRRTANSQSGEQDDAKTHIAPHTWLEQVHLYTAIGAFACENNLQFTSISTDNKLEQRDFIHKDTGFGLKARTPVAVLTNKGGDPLVTNNTVTLFCTALTNKLEQYPFAALTKAKQYIESLECHTMLKNKDVTTVNIHCPYNPDGSHWQHARFTLSIVKSGDKYTINNVKATCENPCGNNAGDKRFTETVTKGTHRNQSFEEALKKVFDTTTFNVEQSAVKKRQIDGHNCGPHTIEMTCAAIAGTHQTTIKNFTEETNGPTMRARHAEWVKNSYEKKIYQDYLEEIKHDAKKDSRLRKKSNRKLARSVLQLAQDVLNKTLDSDGDNKKLKALTTALSNTKHSDQSLITYLNTLPQKDTLIKDTLIKDNTLTFKGKHCRDILVETLCMPVPHNDAHAATAEKTRQPLTAVDISTIKNRLSSDDDTKLMHFLAKQNSNITLVESSLNLLTYQFKVTDDPNSHPTTTQKIGDHYTVIDNTDHSGDKQALVKDYQHLILSMITFDYYQHQNRKNPCPLLNLNIKINEQHQQGPHKDAIENAIKETLKTFAEKNNISVAYQGETPINPLPYQRYNHEPLREFCSKHPKIIREKNEKKILKDALKTLSNSSTPSEYQDITIDQQTVTLSLDGDNLKITVGKQSETVSKDLKAQEVLKKIKSIILEESKKHTNSTQSK